MTNKKLLFATHVGDAGGAELKVLNICHHYPHEKEFVMFQHGDFKAMLSELNINFDTIEMDEGLTNLKRDNGIMGLIKSFPAMLKLPITLSKKARNFDGIVCISQKSFFAFALSKIFHRKPIIWFMNDILTTEQFSPILIKLTKLFSKLFANQVILNSQASLDAWKKNVGESNNLHIIYPTVDFDIFNPEVINMKAVQKIKSLVSPEGKPIIGIVGRLADWKGQHVFIEAISALKDVHGMICGGALFGEEEYETQLKDRVKELGIEERVTFMGHITNVPECIIACDIMAHCSVAPEPFGQVIAQAQALGKPVIATNMGGALEIIEEGVSGKLIPPGDHKALANTINDILENKEQSVSLGKNAYNSVRNKYAHEKQQAIFEKIISDSL